MTKSEMIKTAKTAKFHMEFAVMMLNCGRLEEANTAFRKSVEALAKFDLESVG